MITFSLDIIDSVQLGFKHKQWLKEVVRRENLVVGNISYLFCSDEYLIEQNNFFLNHDTYTDIITFDERVENMVSGSIMISTDRVKENSVKFEKSFEEELLRVMAHGTLHICGYKDKTEDEEKQMRMKENSALNLYYSM